MLLSAEDRLREKLGKARFRAFRATLDERRAARARARFGTAAFRDRPPS